MLREMKEKWEKEKERAKTAIQERKIIDSEELIAEQTLEIFHIPRSAGEIDLLRLADENNCSFETMTALFLMANREGEPRTGANLYAQGSGLLLWNHNWDAGTKTKVWSLHQGLKVGCQDDLDFVLKLAYCFWRTEEKDEELAKRWADYYFVNYETIKGVLDEVKDLFNTQYRQEAEEEEIRNINPQFLERVRQTIASSLVQLPSQILGDNQARLFIDQKFPVDSWVSIREKNGRFYLGELEELPLPIKVSYRKTLDLEELGSKEEIQFNESFFIEEESSVPIEGNWISEQKAEKARIVEWVERDGQPVALLSPFVESDIRSLGKKIGDTLEIKIHRVARDPVGRGGWILARTEEGFEIPVELSEMSLSPRGPSLERIEGQTLTLTIKDLDATGLPQLSNIGKVIEDLNAIRKEISEKNTFPGYVVEINEEEENATTVIEREDGIIHPFEIYKDFVPGRELSSLRIGEEVIINLSMPRTERDHIQADHLTKEEIDNIRMLPNGGYDRNKGEVSFSYCLEDNDFNNWPARSEAIDFVKRHSWQYCLRARIVALKERLSKLNEMDLVEGVIQQIDYEEDGKTVKSVQIVANDNIPGFAFSSDLGSLSVSEGDKILFYVKAVDQNSGFLRLVSKRSEEEKKKQQEEFTRRTQVNIRRWEENIRKAGEAIARRRENIAKNRAKARTARSKEWEDRFKLWIEEDERKIRDIELSIRNWLDKIESAKNKLRRQ